MKILNKITDIFFRNNKKQALYDYTEAENNRKIFREKKRCEFNNLLESLPVYEITLSDNKIKKQKLDDLNVVYRKITKRNKIDTLSTFVAIDIETTGISVRNEILEVSAIKFYDFKPVELFTTLVKPKKEITKEITSINKITNEMVSQKPSIQEIIPSFEKFIDGYNIIGHNLEFDLKFLHVYGVKFSEKVKYYDTLELAKSTLKRGDDVFDHKLETLCDHYYIYRDNAHRASSDCLATGLIFKELLDEKLD